MFEINRIDAPGPVSTDDKMQCRTIPRHKPGQHFLKGPIPLYWLCAASRHCGQGRGFNVGIILWYLCGLHKNKAQIQLKGSVIRAFGLNRYSCYRGLSQLEAAGLVSVERHTGRNPIVTILNGRESEGDSNEP